MDTVARGNLRWGLEKQEEEGGWEVASLLSSTPITAAQRLVSSGGECSAALCNRKKKRLLSHAKWFLLAYSFHYNLKLGTMWVEGGTGLIRGGGGMGVIRAARGVLDKMLLYS